MTKQNTFEQYVIYTAATTISDSQVSTAMFDVSVTSGGKVYSDTFKSASLLGATCSTLGNGTTTPPPPKTNYTYEGCYTDATSARTFSSAATTSANMTIKACSTFCKLYQYFGTEYGSECYCGNTQSSSSTQAASTDCNEPCGGNSSETCGAGLRLSVYLNTAWVPTTSPVIPGWVYQGCYNDSTSSRSLQGGPFYYDSANMTIKSCAAYCAASNSNYFGVEYFSECYCGKVLASESTLQATSDCSYLCSGNSEEYCGGSNRLNLYEIASLATGTTSASMSTKSSVTATSATTTVVAAGTGTTTTTTTFETP
jgi:hypothetical protein